jgi:hypothetical protein
MYKVSMIADTLLIFLPLRTLRELKNQPRLRRRLQSMFTASTLTTCASIVSGAFNLSNELFGYIVALDIEVKQFSVFCPPFLLTRGVYSPLHWQSDRAFLLTSYVLLSSDAELGLPHSLQFCRPRQRLLQTLGQILHRRPGGVNILSFW